MELARVTRRKGKDHLTPSERLFISNLLADPDMDGATAVINSGFNVKNPEQKARTLRAKRHVRDEIEKRIRTRQKRVDIRTDQVIQELANMAFANPQELFDGGGNLRPFEKLPAHLAKAVTNIEIIQDGDKQYKKYSIGSQNKKWALDKLCQHLNIGNGKGGSETNIENINILIAQEEKKRFESLTSGQLEQIKNTLAESRTQMMMPASSFRKREEEDKSTTT